MSRSADSIPRYAEPTWDELRDEVDEFITHKSCRWCIPLGNSDAQTVLNEVNSYSDIKGNRYRKNAVKSAVRRCGICARKTELVSLSEPICDDGFDAGDD